MAKRDTYNYTLKNGNKTVYIGTTNDPKRREQEHRQDGKEFTRMDVVQYPTSRETAQKREEEAIATYKKNHHGERPPYNKNDTGK